MSAITWEQAKSAVNTIAKPFFQIHHTDAQTISDDIDYLSTILPMGPLPHMLNLGHTNDSIDIAQTVAESALEWHTVAGFLKSVQHYPGFKLFKKQFPSGDGFLHQLYVTVYLKKFLDIIDIEDDHGRGADVIALLDPYHLHLHVKHYYQSAKVRAQSNVHKQIQKVLWDNPIVGASGEILGIKSFYGLHSQGLLSDEEMKRLFEGLPENPVREIICSYSDKKKHPTPDNLKITFDWNVERGKMGGINLMKNMEQDLAKINSKVKPENNIKHILVGATPMMDDLVVNQDRLNQEKFSAVFFVSTPTLLGGAGLHVQRSKIYGKDSDTDFLKLLEQSLPMQVDVRV